MTHEGPAEDWLRNTAWHLAQGRFADPESVFLSLVMTTPVEEFRIECEVFLAEPRTAPVPAVDQLAATFNDELSSNRKRRKTSKLWRSVLKSHVSPIIG